MKETWRGLNVWIFAFSRAMRDSFGSLARHRYTRARPLRESAARGLCVPIFFTFLAWWNHCYFGLFLHSDQGLLNGTLTLWLGIRAPIRSGNAWASTSDSRPTSVVICLKLDHRLRNCLYDPCVHNACAKSHFFAMESGRPKKFPTVMANSTKVSWSTFAAGRIFKRIGNQGPSEAGRISQLGHG